MAGLYFILIKKKGIQVEKRDRKIAIKPTPRKTVKKKKKKLS